MPSTPNAWGSGEIWPPIPLKPLGISTLAFSQGRTLCLLIDLSRLAWHLRPLLDTSLGLTDQQRYAQVFSPMEREIRVLTRVALRLVLARLTGCTPADLRIGIGPLGKPFLYGIRNPPGFSVSHTGSLALLALTDGAELGCDIEAYPPTEELPALGALVWHTREAAALAALRGQMALDGWLANWVRKEAVLKALGVGFAIEPRGLDVGWCEPVIAAHRTPEGLAVPALRLHEAVITPDVRAAVATPHASCDWRTLVL